MRNALQCDAPVARPRCNRAIVSQRRRALPFFQAAACTPAADMCTEIRVEFSPDLNLKNLTSTVDILRSGAGSTQMRGACTLLLVICVLAEAKNGWSARVTEAAPTSGAVHEKLVAAIRTVADVDKDVNDYKKWPEFQEVIITCFLASSTLANPPWLKGFQLPTDHRTTGEVQERNHRLADEMREEKELDDQIGSERALRFANALATAVVIRMFV